MVDKIGKRSKLDGETKNFFKEIENREKDVDKKGAFMEYFNYEPTALVNKLLGQNTQDLKKVWTRLNNRRLNQIKMKEIVQIIKMKMTDLSVIDRIDR